MKTLKRQTYCSKVFPLGYASLEIKSIACGTMEVLTKLFTFILPKLIFPQEQSDVSRHTYVQQKDMVENLLQ